MKNTLMTLILAMFLLSSCGGREEARQVPPMQARSNDVHIFYYAWYGTPEIDGAYYHWNHEIDVKNGDPASFPGGNDIGSNFFPAYGCYSSNDPKVLDSHMAQIALIQAGTVCVSWWGKNSFSDKTIPGLLDAAYKYGLKVNFHIEPFEGRTAATTRDAITYIIDTYGQHEAFYKTDRFGKKPMFYIYDSHLILAEEWSTILSPNGSNTIRDTEYDAIMIGLWVEENDGEKLLESHFDGYYTYFGSEGFTYGSTAENWPVLSQWSWENEMIFIPCIAPGYDDTRIRPWNSGCTRERRHGEYFEEMYKSAAKNDPPFLGINSFNEWHKGTQIEPAAPTEIPGHRYKDYEDPNPFYYLKATKRLIKGFSL